MAKKDVKREGAIKKNAKKRAAHRKRKALAFLFLFLFVLLCVGAVLSITVLFPVENVTIEGNSVYSKQQIISACGVSNDDNLITLSEDKVISLISKNLPKSGKITVKKIFPDTVKITVNSAVPKFYITNKNGFYVLDSNKKVIEWVAAKPKNCMYIKCSAQNKTTPGNIFTLKDEEQTMFDSVIALTEKHKLNVTGIDVVDKLNVKIIVDEKILVEFGNNVDIERKMLHFATMYEKFSDDAQGIANLKLWTSSNTTATFRDVRIDTVNFCELKPTEKAE